MPCFLRNFVEHSFGGILHLKSASCWRFFSQIIELFNKRLVRPLGAFLWMPPSNAMLFVLFVDFAFASFVGREIRMGSDCCSELAVPDAAPPPSRSLLQNSTSGAA